LILSPLEFVAAAMEVTAASAQTSVKCKVKLLQDATTNEWVLTIDWDAPTSPPTDSLDITKDTERRTLHLVGLHYACKDSPNVCKKKQYLKVAFKYMTEVNYKKLLEDVKVFETKVKGENFDPSIMSHIHVFEARNHATHSSKTYLLVPAGVEKLEEIMKQINDKYILGQKSIRPSIWAKSKAPSAEETMPVKTKVLWTQAGALVKVSDAAGILNAKGFKNYDTGNILVK
jgi:hypothetical protein